MQYFYISELYRLMGGDGVLIAEDKNLYRTEFPIDLKTLQGEYHAIRKQQIREAIRQYDPKLHDVTDRIKRKDKVTFIPTGEKDPITGEDKLRMELVPPARVPLPIQKYIIKQKASFARGNGVKLRPSDAESKVFKWVYNNWYANKTDFDLRETILRRQSETQCALVFFKDEDSLEKAKRLTDPGKLILKHKIWSPLKGSFLFPYFDPDTESMVALMREYVGTDGKTVYDVYLEADRENGREKPVIRRFKEKMTAAYEQIELPYPKLPIIYWGQEAGECDDSLEAINELENSFSDFSTQMGYSADPILFGKGKVLNLPAKGSAGKFIEGSEDADLKYVTPENATESRDLHFRMLQKWIFSLNRAVILDLDAMKNLSDVSGAALDRYLIDAYLEATDNQSGYWGKGVQRMANFQVAVAKDIYSIPDDETTVDVEFTKYRINDIRETVEVLQLANGNLPLIDHEESVAAAGLVDDPAESYKRILEQQEKADQQTSVAKLAQQKAAAAGTEAPENLI